MKVTIAVLASATALALSGCGGDADSAPTSQAAVTVNASDDAPASSAPAKVGVSPYGEGRSASTGATVTLTSPRRVALKNDAVDHQQKYAEVRVTLHNAGTSPFPSSEVSFRGACAGKATASPKADIGESGILYGPVTRYLQPGRDVRFRLVYTCAEPDDLSVTASVAEGPFATFAKA